MSIVGFDRFQHAKVDQCLLRVVNWEWVELLLLSGNVFVTLISTFISIV